MNPVLKVRFQNRGSPLISLLLSSFHSRNHYYYYSTKQKKNNTSINTDQYEDPSSIEFLNQLKISSLPLHDLFTVQYVRSSGPGGQKVNKTNSKAVITMSELVLHTDLPKYLPDSVFEKYIQYGIKPQYRRARQGGLVISSDGSRSRTENLNSCFQKFIDDIKDVRYRFKKTVSSETVSKWDELHKRDKSIMKRDKIRHSEKKSNRKKIDA